MIRYGWIYTYQRLNFLKLGEIHMNYVLRNSYMHLSHVDMFSVGVIYQSIIKNKLTRFLSVFLHCLRIMLDALLYMSFPHKMSCLFSKFALYDLNVIGGEKETASCFHQAICNWLQRLGTCEFWHIIRVSFC